PAGGPSGSPARVGRRRRRGRRSVDHARRYRRTDADAHSRRGAGVSALIGLDVGTTNTKAVAFDPETGAVIAVASRPTPYGGKGAAREIDPERLWDGVAACLRQVAATIREPIVAVGVASMAEAGVP